MSQVLLYNVIFRKKGVENGHFCYIICGRPLSERYLAELCGWSGCVYQGSYGSMVQRCISKQAADVGVSAPQMMWDHFTAAKIKNLKTQTTIALVRLE